MERLKTDNVNGNESAIRMLLVQDSPLDELFIRGLVDEASSALHICSILSVGEVPDWLARHDADVIVLAVSPESLKLALGRLTIDHPELPVVVLTGDYPLATAGGSPEYLAKSALTPASITRAVMHAAERYRLPSVERDLTRVRRSMDKARRVQKHLLPQAPRSLALDVFGVVHSRDLSGDFYDFLSLVDGRLLVAVGDVTGHGLDAALLMASARAYLRALVDLVDFQDLPHVLELLNGLLCHDVGDERFVALSLVTINLRDMELRYASAGQPHGFLISADGLVQELSCVPCLPLGVEPNSLYLERVFPLRSGDELVLTTDGLLEAQSEGREEFGSGNLLLAMHGQRGATARSTAVALFAELQRFCGGREHLRDDVTIVVIKIPLEIPALSSYP